MDKKVLRNLSYGVYVVTSKENDKNVGCIANSIMQVTSNPSTIAISINHDNYTNKVIKENKKFGISILKENSVPICQYSLDGEFIKEWNSIVEASKYLLSLFSAKTFILSKGVVNILRLLPFSDRHILIMELGPS